MSSLRTTCAILGSGLAATACNPSSAGPEAGAPAPAGPEAGPDAGSDALAALFRDGSPEDVAAALEAMVEAQAGDASDAADSAADAPDGKPAAKKRAVKPSYPDQHNYSARPMYKGISA